MADDDKDTEDEGAQRDQETAEHSQETAEHSQETAEHSQETTEQRTTQRDVVMHSPEGDADEPDARKSDEEVPSSIYEQTKEGEEPYQWHTGTKRDHGSTDAIEFIDVKKSFGRTTILNGLNFLSPTTRSR